jgi:polyisoprenoid-binding protein YceI
MTAEATKPSVLSTGTWTIDPAHTSVGFTVRHLMISKVRGSFTTVSGSVTVPEGDPFATVVDVIIDPVSITTGEANRDVHLRSADFLDVEKFPAIAFRSTSITAAKGGYQLGGDLTMHGVTRSVSLDVEFDGVGTDPWGNTKAGFSASGEINRKDWGLEYNAALEAGGVLIGENIKLQFDVQLAQAK